MESSPEVKSVMIAIVAVPTSVRGGASARDGPDAAGRSVTKSVPVRKRSLRPCIASSPTLRDHTRLSCEAHARDSCRDLVSRYSAKPHLLNFRPLLDRLYAPKGALGLYRPRRTKYPVSSTGGGSIPLCVPPYCM